jgi:hypothetical protein
MADGGYRPGPICSLGAPLLLPEAAGRCKCLKTQARLPTWGVCARVDRPLRMP